MPYGRHQRQQSFGGPLLLAGDGPICPWRRRPRGELLSDQAAQLSAIRKQPGRVAWVTRRLVTSLVISVYRFRSDCGFVSRRQAAATWQSICRMAVHALRSRPEPPHVPDASIRNDRRASCSPWETNTGHRVRGGEPPTGFRLYETRWKTDRCAFKSDAHHQPLWQGERDIAGHTIFVWSDEGIGDTVQFIRFVSQLATRGVRIVQEAQ